jgi:DNA repair exonuclease SbcCD ATPase subunit
MIKIKDLTVRNFMSVGNITQAVNFNKEKLTLVLGENLDQGGDDNGSRNGTGKTSIINALSYALYGTALTNIRKNNLINKTNNKGMLVTLHFEKDGLDYRIERGRAPNFLKFYINEHAQEITDESQGDSRRTQDTINDLLGMSHDMFKHIVALNTYTEPFLSMRTNDQRAIIEQLLGITILSEKADVLKEKVRATKNQITEETLKIDAIQTANSKIEHTIKSLGTKQKMWNKKKQQDIDNLLRAISELEHLDITKELVDHENLSNWTDTNNKVVALSKEKITLESALTRAEKTVNTVQQDINDLECAKCYACGQELQEDKKKEIDIKKSKEYDDAMLYYTEVTSKFNKVVIELDEIGNVDSRPSTFYETMKEAYEHQNNVASLQQALESKSNEEDPYQSQIEELQTDAIQEITWFAVNDLTSYKEHQEFLLKLLTNKDSFIRKKIIDQNLAYLNHRLSYYLDRLGLPHQVTFQNDLNVEITQLGQDLDFDNLSRGERNRLILGLSFAFRDVWESLYQNINLLFIDELIDSGLDSAGVESALSVLKKIGREREKNIFLISHKDELIGRVNHILKVIKDGGFTSYANDIDVVE